MRKLRKKAKLAEADLQQKKRRKKQLESEANKLKFMENQFQFQWKLPQPIRIWVPNWSLLWSSICFMQIEIYS